MCSHVVGTLAWRLCMQQWFEVNLRLCVIDPKKAKLATLTAPAETVTIRCYMSNCLLLLVAALVNKCNTLFFRFAFIAPIPRSTFDSLLSTHP